jgi:hypothetical protein
VAPQLWRFIDHIHLRQRQERLQGGPGIAVGRAFGTS